MIGLVIQRFHFLHNIDGFNRRLVLKRLERRPQRLNFVPHHVLTLRQRINIRDLTVQIIIIFYLFQF